jgi:hypothetical protein
MNFIKTACKTSLVAAGFIVFYVSAVFALGSIHLKRATLLQILTSNIGETGAWGQSLRRFREIQNIHGLDILFVGSSTAYRGYDPRFFKAEGYSSFNMGSTCQTPMNTYFLLKYYLPKIKPKVILFDLDPRTMSLDGYESTLDLLRNTPLSWELLEMSLATGNPHAVTNFIWSFIRDQERPLTKFNQLYIPGETYIPGGYVETGKVREMNVPEETHNPDGYVETSMLLEKDLEGKIGNDDLLKNQLNYCSKIIALAKSLDINIVEVIPPLSKDFMQTIADYTAIVNSLRLTADKYKVVFIDSNSLVSLDPINDYKDIYHLNKRGVLKYNETLYDILKTRRTLD